MFTISTQAHVRQIKASFQALGVPAPPAVTDALDLYDKIVANSRTMRGDNDQLVSAIVRSLTAGKDPSVDREVQRLTTSQALTSNVSILEGIDQQAQMALAETVSALSGEIVTVWAEHFTSAAATLAECREPLGSLPLEDSTSILARGSEAAKAWTRATAADRNITIVVEAWSALGQLTRQVPLDQHHRILRLADVTYDDWVIKELRGRKMTAWQAVCADLSLSLATFAQYRQRVANIAAEAQARADQWAQEQHDQMTGRRKVTVSRG